jgi:hypothetical protein
MTETKPDGVTTWRKKPVEVQMIRWDGTDEAARLITEQSGRPGSDVMLDGGSLQVWVEKSQAHMLLARGDWAALERDGVGVYPVTDEARQDAYEPAAEDQGDADGGRVTVSPGVQAIANERSRQVTEEGWTAEHDAQHGPGVLARAGACYAWYAAMGYRLSPITSWPFDERWWKPGSGEMRTLVKAGALICAEIDRLSAAAGSA